MFGATNFGAAQPTRSVFGGAAAAPTTAPTTNHNPMKDVEVQSPPDDTVSKMQFSPSTLPQVSRLFGMERPSTMAVQFASEKERIKDHCRRPVVFVRYSQVRWSGSQLFIFPIPKRHS